MSRDIFCQLDPRLKKEKKKQQTGSILSFGTQHCAVKLESRALGFTTLLQPEGLQTSAFLNLQGS